MQALEGLNIFIFLCLWLSVTLNGCGMVVQLKWFLQISLGSCCTCFGQLKWVCLPVDSQIRHLQGGCKSKTQ